MASLRIPRGLWDDLEESVIKQDRQFLIEVARNLGLPVQDVLRKCLGGAPTSVPVLWMHDYAGAIDICPWATKVGSLWFPCQRKRLSPNLPCCVHERDKIKLSSELGDLLRRIPVSHKGRIFWVDPTEEEPPLKEDGTVAAGSYLIRKHKGKTIALYKPA
jgi:hypothetical protein